MKWLNSGMLWELLTLSQARSLAGHGGATCLISRRKETET